MSTAAEDAKKVSDRKEGMYLGMCVVALEQGGYTVQADNLRKEATKNPEAASALLKARSDFETALKAWK